MKSFRIAIMNLKRCFSLLAILSVAMPAVAMQRMAATALARRMPMQSMRSMSSLVLRATPQAHRSVQPAKSLAQAAALTRTMPATSSTPKQCSYALQLAAGLNARAFTTAAHAQEDAEHVEKTPTFSIEQREAAKQAYYAKLKAKPWGKVAEKYIKQLEDGEKALMQEWYTTLGCTAEQWQQFLVQQWPGFIAANKNRTKENIQAKTWVEHTDAGKNAAIDALLCECEVDPKYIKKFRDTSKNTCSARQNLIFIGDDLPEGPFKSTIAHEIQHILHNDSFVEVRLNNAANGSNSSIPSKKEREKFITKFNKFQERRADILAGLLAPTHAYHLAEFFGQVDKNRTHINHYIATYPEHPTCLERYRYMRQLHQEMAPGEQPPQGPSLAKEVVHHVPSVAAYTIFAAGIMTTLGGVV